MLKQKRVWLGLLVSIVLLAYVFYQTDPAKIGEALAQAQYEYVLPALALYFIGVGVRAVRWHYLLRPIKTIPSGALFRAVVIGYMANNVLPLRMGEIVRAYMLGAQEQVSKTATLVTILVERVFDGLTMLTFIVAASFFLDLGGEMNARVQFISAIFIAVILAMAIAAGMPRRVERLAEAVLTRVPAAPLRERALKLTRAVLEGLGALRSPRDSLAVFALSLIVWLFECGMYVVIAFGFNLHLPFAVFLVATALANLVTIAPSTPGYVGVFDAPIVYILTTFGVNPNVATSYTLVLHAALYLPVTLLGLYYLWRAGLSLAQITQRQS